ncbi:MAG: PLP-dependent aspartate aminotransferase family protein [Chloroflexota bacterium]|nr:PLP-dependent transferase [Chloroflexia bacterium]MDQ3227606.1 PLP-dependent aspartate aminotransferase family protein [Chloroflexota bacterium]
MTAARGFGTRCIHAGEAPDPTTGAHGVPIYQNVTYAFETHGQIEAMRCGERPHFTYSPRANPTVRCLEVKLADLEGTETSVALGSGMAAISGTLMTLLADGGHVIASDQLYDLTKTFLTTELPSLGSSATFVDVSDAAAVERAITPQTRAIYAEPFSNPLLRVTDPRLLAEMAHRHDLILIMDNTFLSPALLRPADLGADIVIHSATKYLSGNGHVQGGIVSGPRRHIEPIRAKISHLGTALSPFAAWLLLAGIHTLPLRMERHSENALTLASMLAAHPAVEDVHYPGLASDPGHSLAKDLLGMGHDRYGGMISFSLKGGRAEFGPFLDSLRLCTIAVSLGDCSTLIWPWHEGNLVRISTGLEDSRDLMLDVSNALDACLPAVAAD